MYRSASNTELLTLDWEEMCSELVKGMFGGYASSCGDCEWFYEIDLSQALSVAARVLLQTCGWQIPQQQVHDSISGAFQAQLHHRTLEKSLWEAVDSLFGHDEKARTKVYNAISRSYEPALERALADLTPQEDLARVECFVRNWIDDSTCRAWGGLHEQAEEVLNKQTLVQIFDHLLQPFGDDHPFSAIPSVLIEDIGSPPPGWDFIPTVVDALFEQWANQEGMPSKRRKKKATEEGDEGEPAEDAPLEGESVKTE